MAEVLDAIEQESDEVIEVNPLGKLRFKPVRLLIFTIKRGGPRAMNSERAQ